MFKILVASFTLATILTYVFGPIIKIKMEVQETLEIYKEENPEATNSILKLTELVDSHGIQFPAVVICVIFHETGGLKSRIYKECNNLVGMKHNKRGYSKGICRGHAKYDNVHDSLMDYKAWQQRQMNYYRTKYKKEIKTNEEYIDFLVQMNYAEDKMYKVRLKTWLSKINNNLINNL